MTLLLTLVAGLVLVGITNGSARISDRGTRSSKTVPRHMVGSATPVTLDWRKGGRVQGASRRRRTGGKSTTSAVRAGAREVSKAAAIIALLSGVLQPQTGTLSLDVAYSPARVTLLSSD